MLSFSFKNEEMNIDTFKKCIASAHEDYFSWNENYFCPYFQEDVRITHAGWEHIMGIPRSRIQKYWRAKNLLYVPVILKKTTTVQKETRKHSSSGIQRLWSFVSIENGNILEVVIRQIGNQPKHFYSFVYKGIAPRIIS